MILVFDVFLKIFCEIFVIKQSVFAGKVCENLKALNKCELYHPCIN